MISGCWSWDLPCLFSIISGGGNIGKRRGASSKTPLLSKSSNFNFERNNATESLSKVTYECYWHFNILRCKIPNETFLSAFSRTLVKLVALYYLCPDPWFYNTCIRWCVLRRCKIGIDDILDVLVLQCVNPLGITAWKNNILSRGGNFAARILRLLYI